MSKDINTHANKGIIQRHKVYAVLLIFIVFIILVVIGFRDYRDFIDDPKVNFQEKDYESKLALQFKQGTQLVYSFNYTNSSNFDFGALFKGSQSNSESENNAVVGAAQTIKTSVKGDFVSTVLEATKDCAVMAYTFRRPSITLNIDGRDQIEESLKIQSSLRENVYAVLNPQGKVLSVWLNPDLDRVCQNYIRALLGISQVVLDNTQAGHTQKWTIKEEDPNGIYSALYEIQKDQDRDNTDSVSSDLLIIRKTKVEYFQKPDQVQCGVVEAPCIIKPYGNIIIKYNITKGLSTSLEGTENQEVFVSGKRIAYSSTNLQMQYFATEVLQKPDLKSVRNDFKNIKQRTLATSLVLEVSDQTSEEIIQCAKLGKNTLNDLLVELSNAERTVKKNYDDTDLYLKFKALIYLQPEYCPDLEPILFNSDPNSLSMRLLAGALCSVGNPAAQSVLVRTIKRRDYDWSVLALLIPALGDVDTPTKETEAIINDLANNSKDPNISSMARLALGLIAKNLADDDPDRSVKIVKYMINKLENSKTLSAQREFLLSLGNSRSALALSAIKNYISDDSPNLRATSVSALSWINSDEADSLLVQTLLFDADSTVRVVAAQALGCREISPALYEFQKKVLFSEKAQTVRMAILDNLSNVKDKFPEAEHLIRQIAEDDKSIEVRKVALNIIKKI